jgi:hypothetical protein
VCFFEHIFFDFSYLLTIETTNQSPNSEGNTKMKKLLVASFAFISLVVGLSSAPAMAGEFSGASFERASFATLTPSMAARGQRFYVGD